MKKQLLNGLLITVAACTLFPTSIFATTTDAKTDTSAKFQAGDGTEKTPVKPGTPDPIEIVGGNTTTGNLRFEYVPDIDFGEGNTYSAGGANYKVMYNTYKENAANNGAMTEYTIPAFVQVTDVRGTVTKFEVTVKQDSPFVNDVDNHKLSKARIYLNAATYTNSVGSESKLEDKFKDNAGQPKSLIIPTTGDSNPNVSIMKTSQSVDGSISSVVFFKNYQENNFGKNNNSGTVINPNLPNKKTDPTFRNDGITLNVPAGQEVRTNGTYRAKLTWTLNDTPL